MELETIMLSKESQAKDKAACFPSHVEARTK
jgi:hypothetical protein